MMYYTVPNSDPSAPHVDPRLQGGPGTPVSRPNALLSRVPRPTHSRLRASAALRSPRLSTLAGQEKDDYDYDALKRSLRPVVRLLRKKEHEAFENKSSIDPKKFPLHYACDVLPTLPEEFLLELRNDFQLSRIYTIDPEWDKSVANCVVKLLVEHDGCREDLLNIDDQGRLPLHWACSHDTDVDVINYLLDTDVTNDKNGKEALYHNDKNGLLPFHLAAAHASIDVMKDLRQQSLQKEDVALIGRTKYWWFPLHYACLKRASFEVVEYLVEIDEKVLGYRDTHGNCPLHLACQMGATFQVINYLVEGSDSRREILLRANDNGDYPLHLACKYKANTIEVIRFLVENAEEALHRKNNEQRYPLHLACMTWPRSPFEIVRYLIGRSPIEMGFRDASGNIPFDLIAEDNRRVLLSNQISPRTTGVADTPSQVDRLNYLLYAQALSHAARQAELPGSSLCVGLYGRWGAGKTTLWKQTRKCLHVEFLLEDVRTLYQAQNLNYADNASRLRETDESATKARVAFAAAVKSKAKVAFAAAVKSLVGNEYVPVNLKEVWLSEMNDTNLQNSEASISLFERMIRAFLLLSDCIFGSVSKDKLLLELEDKQETINQSRCRRRLLNARARRDERITQWFLLFVIFLWPLLLVIVVASKRISEDEILIAQAKRVERILKGDTSLADGDTYHWKLCDVLSCLFVVPLHAIVFVTGIIAYLWSFLVNFMKQDSRPIGATAYEIVEFNAWEYQGSDLLWASLIKKLWDVVEKRYGKLSVRYHRASIALAGETPFKELDFDLTPDERTKNRKRALFMFRIRLAFFAFIFVLVLAISIVILTPETQSDHKSGFTSKEMDATNEAEFTSSNTVTDSDLKLIRSIVLIVSASIPILTQIITFFRKVLPYLLRTQGEYIFMKATRKDFKEQLGFMGEVKAEVEYLFDLLSTETFLDNDVDCLRHLRLCVFIDDLDRCPEKIVVQVLEAVILLLVDGPISVWMAIDSRIVIKCIEAVKKDVFEEANISGHEFLDKIVQMPFSLPTLPNKSKLTYLNKVIESQDLEPRRLLSRARVELRKKRDELNSDDLHKLFRDMQYSQDRPCALSQLVPFAVFMCEFGMIDRQSTEFGIRTSDLIELVDKKRLEVTKEEKESFCSVIADGMSKFQSHDGANENHRENTTENGGPNSPGNSQNEDTNVNESENTTENGGSNLSDERHDENANLTEKETRKINFETYLNVLRAGQDIYVPMLNDDERKCLKECIPFIDGNPRKMKRIINVFNVSRHIAESKVGSTLYTSTLKEFTPKLLKFNIMLEQWPFRTAWLLQFIEDVEQICLHGTHERIQRNVLRILKENFSDELGQGTPEPLLETIREINIKDLYERVVHGMMLSCSGDKSKALSVIDADPKLFAGLLSESSVKVEVKDFLSTKDTGSTTTLSLRDYAFNVSHAMTDQVSILLSDALLKGMQSREDQATSERTHCKVM